MTSDPNRNVASGMPSMQPLVPRADVQLRSGAAARLAGVPVATLRVWERRYGVVAAPKTPTGQRLYSGHDVQRLRLLKKLRDLGHAIGSIAALDLASLEALSASASPPPAPNAGVTRRVVVVGPSAAHRLKVTVGCELLAVYEDLAQAEQRLASLRGEESQRRPAADREPASAPAHEHPLTRANVLLVHMPSLQPASAARVLALGALLKGAAIFVVYAFGAESVAETLRAAGATVRREPATGRELARMISSAPAPGVPAPSLDTSLDARAAAAPRRFSDEALARIAETRSQVACECPRHVAEIVMQLAGFERYSADCTTGNLADKALHQHLSALAAVARGMFEQALERIVDEQGFEATLTSV